MLEVVFDECIPEEVAQGLRAEGHDVVLIADLSPGVSDLRVLSYARERATVVVTADKDFGDLVYREAKPTSGVILLRAGRIGPVERARLLAVLVEEHAAELVGAFTVLTQNSLRIRRLD